MASRAAWPASIEVVIPSYCNVACNVASGSVRFMAASLKQVAERAGVSVRTVSNVVTGFALVAADTRARVQRAIDELEYRPNAAARHLRGGRSGLVGLVIPEITSPYFAELAGHLVEE